MELPSSLSMTSKTALITGASKGIGRATALALARLGANIVVNYSSDASAANELVHTITSMSSSPTAKLPRAIAIKADASDLKEMERLVKETVDVYGKIDVLIPNAGTMPMADLEGLTLEVFDKVMDMNVRGPLFLAQKAVPHMPPGSRIIFLSTTLCAASTVSPTYLPYCASKGAIEQIVRVLSKDLAGRKGISVNAVAPGPTGTDFFYNGKSEQLVNMIAGANPHKRIGTPEEVAEALAWLGTGASGWVTGQVLRANGGMA